VVLIDEARLRASGQSPKFGAPPVGQRAVEARNSQSGTRSPPSCPVTVCGDPFGARRRVWKCVCRQVFPRVAASGAGAETAATARFAEISFSFVTGGATLAAIVHPPAGYTRQERGHMYDRIRLYPTTGL
jgi:hypothetical protein